MELPNLSFNNYYPSYTYKVHRERDFKQIDLMIRLSSINAILIEEKYVMNKRHSIYISIINTKHEIKVSTTGAKYISYPEFSNKLEPVLKAIKMSLRKLKLTDAFTNRGGIDPSCVFKCNSERSISLSWYRNLWICYYDKSDFYNRYEDTYSTTNECFDMRISEFINGVNPYFEAPEQISKDQYILEENDKFNFPHRKNTNY